MISKKAFEKLKDLNLNIYEANLYAAILSRGISSAGELADISTVPRSRCYDVLESLEKKGFVFQKIGKPIRYIAIPPEEVVDTLKKQARMEERRQLSFYEEMKETGLLDEMQSLYHASPSFVDSSEISSLITGRNAINTALKQVFSKAKNILVHTTKDGLKRKLKLIKKSSPKAKVTIYAPANGLKERNIRFINKDTSLRAVQADDQLFIFTSAEDIKPEQETAIWIKSRFVSEALKGFLEQ